ncbi:MFS transporter [Rhizosphaericola mali]|uniref:MFS transporter n=1 Tax=Rhizosphaericola mali TaxID=2545455 RepID=A0A5P2G302_9BACT|nr:MFS transporter [Rhizosphaericola mali]QES88499.1 MFS transporter [Rhizosphaericola mali]
MNKKFAYVGGLGMLAVITTEFGIIGILPQIATYYNIAIDKAGYLLSVFALIIALTGPIMTLVASKYDRKKVMLLSIFLFIVTGVVSFFQPPFWLLLIVRILPAFLQPVYISTALSVAVSGAENKYKNELMSIVFSGIAIAMVTTVPFATWLASLYTWKYSFIIQSIVSILSFVIIYSILPSLPVKVKKSFSHHLSILKNPIFLVSTIMNIFMITSWFSTYSYFADYLGKAKNMSNTMISYMLFLFGIMGVFSVRIAGKMLNKNVTQTTLLFLLGTILIPILLYYSGGNTITTIVVVAIWGFLYTPSFLNASTYMISSVPNHLEFANSLATSTGNLGVSLGTMIGGGIIVSKGISNVPWVGLLFGILAIIMVFTRVLMERKSKKKPRYA